MNKFENQLIIDEAIGDFMKHNSVEDQCYHNLWIKIKTQVGKHVFDTSRERIWAKVFNSGGTDIKTTVRLQMINDFGQQGVGGR